MRTLRVNCVDRPPRSLVSFYPIYNNGNGLKIVTLGAGFDTLALRLTAAGRRDVRVLEIDYASVLAAKAKLLANSSAPPLSPENYVATSADLSDVSATEKALIDAGVDKTLPTLILSEV